MPVTSKLRIVVSGLAVTYPFGGVFWDYMNYLLGFLRLGHDVMYLEDTGKWVYDPAALTFVESGAGNASQFASNIESVMPDLIGRWFFRDGAGVSYGKSWEEAASFCRSADLFVNLSASAWMEDDYFQARQVIFIDSDPMYSQARAFLEGELTAEDQDYVTTLAESKLFTFGENVGRPDCAIPQGPYLWRPTRQPIVLDALWGSTVPVRERRRVLTTVSSWEPTLNEGPEIQGRKYFGKSVELLRYIDLPRRVPLPVEIAISGKVPRAQFAEHGWTIRNPVDVSRDPLVYRDYLATSFAELSVAKNAYVDSRSGWFSCRSACYLAMGVPVVVQETGFSDNIPCGEGLFAFSSVDEAGAAVEAILSAPERHAAAAREVAAEYFDSNRVLTRLIDEALAAPSQSGAAT